eukprot:3894681-Karenia_brevis.AAC.1
MREDILPRVSEEIRQEHANTIRATGYTPRPGVECESLDPRDQLWASESLLVLAQAQHSTYVSGCTNRDDYFSSGCVDLHAPRGKVGDKINPRPGLLGPLQAPRPPARIG